MLSPAPAGKLAATIPAPTEVAATKAIWDGSAPMMRAKSSRQASPSSSQPSHDDRPRQPRTASSTAARVDRGGRPYVAVSRYPRVGVPLYSNGASNVLEGFGVLDCGEIARILAERLGPDRAADDLGAPGLGQSRDEHDAIRLEGAPESTRRLLGHLDG